MCDITVLTIRSLAARHGNEQSFLAFDDLDVMNNKLVIYGNGNDCFHFPFFFDLSHSHICYLHVETPPPFLCGSPETDEMPTPVSRLRVFMMS